jgi:hypothetical protein
VSGQSFTGKPFTREELRTAATWIDQTGPGENTGGYDRAVVDLIQKCCRLSSRLMIAILIILLLLLLIFILAIR